MNKYMILWGHNIIQKNNQDVLNATLHNVRNLINLLKSIKFTDSTVLFATDQGFKFTVEDGKCMQANAFLQKDLFDFYNITEEFIVKLPLKVLLHCLLIFGGTSSTVIKFVYEKDGFPLHIVLEEPGISTECSIRTFEPDDLLDFRFNGQDVINKVIMQSSKLKEVFLELDATSESIDITMSPDEPYLRFATIGIAASTDVSVPKNASAVEVFQCTEVQTFSYKLSFFKRSVKALALANRVSIRIDNRGFLSMQYLLKTDDDKTSFVEFYCAPNED